MPFINELNEDTLIQPENYALDLPEQESSINNILAPLLVQEKGNSGSHVGHPTSSVNSQVVLKDDFSEGLPKIEQQWDKVG